MMAFLTLPKHKLVDVSLVIAISFCFYSGSSAQDNPIQNALICFNNKFIYAGCDEAYRLDRSGSINVPPQAMGLFCNGPCLTETQLVLNCLDNIFSNFLFYNKATIGQVRGVINLGCTYNRDKGIFNWNNFGRFAEGELSSAERLENSVVFTVFLVIVGFGYFFILY